MTNVASRRILALDLGTRLGWALARGAGVESGATVCSGDSLGERMLSFERLVQGLLAHADECWYEAPHCPSLAARDIVYGQQGILVKECRVRTVSAHRRSANTIKKHATGNGRCGKLAMLDRACEIAGREIIDHNQADAVCLLALARGEDR